MQLYRAYRTWSEEPGVVILANTKEEATEKALDYFNIPEADRKAAMRGVPLVTVSLMPPTHVDGVYKI